MLTFEWIIGLLLGAVLLSAPARRIKVPYPTFLALGGVLLAFPPRPLLEAGAELALALFVAPVLLDAAYDTSLRDLRANWLPVTTLVVVAVGVTTAAVAVLARGLEPDMPWAAAIALGAIVAPPDAAAATAILRQVNLPYRILKVLEGESLLNDASALLIYRIAVGAATVDHLKLSAFAPPVLLGVAGSLIAGYVFGRISMGVAPPHRSAERYHCAVRRHLHGLDHLRTDRPFRHPDHRGLRIHPGAHRPGRTPARLRVPAYAVWDTVVFVLNVLAFMLIGLQLSRSVRLDEALRPEYCLFAAIVLRR